MSIFSHRGENYPLPEYLGTPFIYAFSDKGFTNRIDRYIGADGDSCRIWYVVQNMVYSIGKA